MDEVVRYLQGAIDEASLVRLGSLPVRLGVVGISTAWTSDHGQNQALNGERSPSSVTITLAPADRIMERQKLLPPIEPEHS